jgi:hypothetical protein
VLCVTVCERSRGTLSATSTTLSSSRCDCSHGTLPVSAAAKTESADAVKLVGLRRRTGGSSARAVLTRVNVATFISSAGVFCLPANRNDILAPRVRAAGPPALPVRPTRACSGWFAAGAGGKG